MADRLYLSLWIRGFNEVNMLAHFGKLLDLFPFSKLAARGPVLRVYAIQQVEPPLIEREFPLPVEISEIIESALEFTQADCSVQLEASWDLWQYDGDWKLRPAPVTLACYGPAFENEIGDHLRIEFGIDTHFLPQPDVEGSARLVQSNVQSMLSLVAQIDEALDLERRQLWSESGANFAEVLAKSVGIFNVN
jgi:hypothetical protein